MSTQNSEQAEEIPAPTGCAHEHAPSKQISTRSSTSSDLSGTPLYCPKIVECPYTDAPSYIPVFDLSKSQVKRPPNFKLQRKQSGVEITASMFLDLYLPDSFIDVIVDKSNAYATVNANEGKSERPFTSADILQLFAIV